MCSPCAIHYFYPIGSDGYHIGIKDTVGKKISLCDYSKFHLFFRENDKFVPHFYASKLFQQFIVDQTAKIEGNDWSLYAHTRLRFAVLIIQVLKNFLEINLKKLGLKFKKNYTSFDIYGRAPQHARKFYGCNGAS